MRAGRLSPLCRSDRLGSLPFVTGDVAIRHLRPEELDAFRECLDLAFHEQTSPEAAERWMRNLDYARTAAAFDGETLVGTSGSFAQRISVSGGELPCAGVSVVTVRPTHRRRGILTRMMRALIDDALAAGEPLAALWAAEGGIYERFGFGVASQVARITMDGGGTPPRRSPDVVRTVELLPLEAGARDLLNPLWERVRTQRAGIPARTASWWEHRVLADHEDERDDGQQQKRLLLTRDGEGVPQGYAIYRARETEPATTLEVLELIAPDPEADAALWAYFCGVDLVGRVELPGRPVDDPIKYRFADFGQAHVVDVNDALWLRLLDVPAALAGRAWAAPLDLTVELADAQVPANAGTWRIEASAEGDARCTRGDRAPDLVLGVSALGAAYLGGTPPARLADAGRIEERTAGAIERLDAALRAPRAPWAPEDF